VRKIVFAAFCFAVSCEADGITSSFSCSLDSISMTNSTGCNLTGPAGTALATYTGVNGPNLMPLQFAPTTQFDAGLDLFGAVEATTEWCSQVVCVPYFAEATAQVSYSVTATSAGPDRMGVIHVSIWCGNFFSDPAQGSSNASVGNYQPSCGGNAGLSTVGAFELGVPFAIQMSGNANARTSVDYSEGNALPGARISYQLFEADGVTPVDTFSATTSAMTPEPGTAGLLGAAIGLIAWRKTRSVAWWRNPLDNCRRCEPKHSA
jgi:hypothetical protein